MTNTNIHNGFIQRVKQPSPLTATTETRDWQYRAWSNHLGSDEHFTLLTHGAAVHWLWIIDEIYRGRANRNRARD